MRFAFLSLLVCFASPFCFAVGCAGSASTPADGGISCPRPDEVMRGQPCSPPSAVCPSSLSSTQTSCACRTGTWLCNDPACPAAAPTGACTEAGLNCDYGTRTAECVSPELTWVSCGDTVGLACSAPGQEGSLCCPNSYISGAACCGESQGLNCSCTNFHVHCTACAAAVDAATE